MTKTYLTDIKAYLPTREVSLEDAGRPLTLNVLDESFYKGVTRGKTSVQMNMIYNSINDEFKTKYLDIFKNSDLKTGFILACGNVLFHTRFEPDEMPAFLEYTTINPISFIPSFMAGSVANALGITDYVGLDSSSCNSVNTSINTAQQLIELGKIDRCVIVVCGDAINPSETYFFPMIGLVLSNAQEAQGIKPSAFDSVNFGARLGQGCGYLIVENEKSIAETKNDKNFLVKSVVFSTENNENAQKQTEDGLGYQKLITQTLDFNKISPNDIDIIKTHGSGTKNNNLSEGNAIHKFFSYKYTKATAYKPIIGNSIGSSNLLELHLLLEELKNRKIEKIRNRTDTDENDIFLTHDFQITKDHLKILNLTVGLGNIYSGLLIEYNYGDK
jgi:3-oxoacyl-(acyl-carrier-protein) synthase